MSVSLNYPFVKYLVVLLCAVIIILLFIRMKRRIVALIAFCAIAVAFEVCRAVFLGGFDSYDYIAYSSEAKNDMICVYTDKGSSVIDISSGKKKRAVEAVDFTIENYFDRRLDCYVYTHYHDLCVSTLENISQVYYINSVLMPKPLSEKEERISKNIKNVCNENDIDFYYYTDGGFMLGDHMKVTPVHTYVNSNSHPVIAVKISSGSGDVCYVGSSYLLTEEIETSGEVVIFGSHGKKQTSSVKIDSSIGTTVYSSETQRELNDVESENEIITDGEGEFIVLRIEK